MASSNATSLQLYLRLLRYVKPYWAPFALSIAAMMVVAATEPTLPIILKPLLDGSFVHKEGGLFRARALRARRTGANRRAVADTIGAHHTNRRHRDEALGPR